MTQSSQRKQLKLIKTLWGIDEPNFKSIKEEGYHGIEIIRLAYLFDREGLIQNLNEAQLAVVCQVHTCGGYFHDDTGEYVYCGSDSVKEHKIDFKKQLLECKELLHEVNAGGLINVHAGVDCWSMGEAIDFLTFCLEEIERSADGITVTLETHRQRLFGSPFQTRDILDQLELSMSSSSSSSLLDGLKLNADLSHWYVACERVFDPTKAPDERWWPMLLDRVAERCHYIHARFGWAQGPQMADPSAKECEADCKLQLSTWAVLMERQKARDDGRDIYISPEYGPAPYLAAMPHTQTPVAALPAAVSYTKCQIESLFQANKQS